MFQRKPRRFRRHQSDRNQMLRGGSKHQNRQRLNSFTNGQNRNNFRTPLSAEKLFEKYTSLAKEATSSGDKTLSENYLQHADHFMRIIEEKNRNRSQNKVNVVDKPIKDDKNFTVNDFNNQDNEIKN
jgi:hypothetical protein|tara:strand:- start:299 stop:679 length:381 start_codon:yes stop_codon:yes gene_type:complete